MKITKRCRFDGKTYTMDIPALTPEKLDLIERYRQKGALIQNCASYLNADEREFLMTGTPPEVWNKMFPET
jgi:hypothetical protein